MRNKKIGVKKIGLFGSVVKGNLKEDSDIDLIVEFEKGKATFENVGKLIEVLENLFEKEVDILTPIGVESIRRDEIKNSIKTDMKFEEFLKDKKTQDAVIWNIEIIGEGAKNISQQLKNKYPSIPWKYIIRTRNKIIHHYFGIDLDIIWDIISQDISKLIKKVKEIIQKEEKG